MYNLERLENLGFALVNLIARGKNELPSTVQQVAESGELIKYLSEKYPEEIDEATASQFCKIDDWEESFKEESVAMIGSHSAAEEYGIGENGNGLLLVLGLTLKLVAARQYKK